MCVTSPTLVCAADGQKHTLCVSECVCDVTVMSVVLKRCLMSLLQWNQLELGLGLSWEQHPGRVWNPPPGVRPSVGAVQQSHLQGEGENDTRTAVVVLTQWYYFTPRDTSTYFFSKC